MAWAALTTQPKTCWWRSPRSEKALVLLRALGGHSVCHQGASLTSNYRQSLRIACCSRMMMMSQSQCSQLWLPACPFSGFCVSNTDCMPASLCSVVGAAPHTQEDTESRELFGIPLGGGNHMRCATTPLCMFATPCACPHRPFSGPYSPYLQSPCGPHALS